MPYIGTSPSNGVRRVHTYTATASQTTFTGASSEGVTLSYADTNYIDVFQNGVLLGSADYTSTSGTSVVLAQGASADDLIVIVVYDVFSVADTVSKTNGGTFDSAVTMSNNLTVSGAFTSQGIDDNATSTAITVDSSQNVAIGGTDTSYGKFSVRGGYVYINEDNANTNQIYIRSDFGGDPAIQVATSHALKFATGNQERMRILSSGGITFNGDTATANALDDYEEGTWTPIISQPSNRVGTWASSVLGTYTKVGRKVNVHATINGSGMYFSSTGGYTAITGFPFTATQPTGSTAYAGSWTGSSVAASSGGSVYLYANTGYFHAPNSSQSSSAVNNIGMSITYFTDS